MNIYYVYTHLIPDTGEVFYVGKGKNKRAFESRSRNKFWKNTVNKHGLKVEIVQYDMLEADALSLEIKLIAELKPKCNLTSGGQGCSGYRFDADLVKNRNETNKNRYLDKNWVEKRNKKLREAMAKPEVRLKIALSQKLIKDQILAGLRPKKKGRFVPEEERLLISQRQKGKNAYWYGKRTVVAKAVSNLTTGESFPSVREAAESVGGKYRGLSKAIKANRKFKGYLFKYKE